MYLEVNKKIDQSQLCSKICSYFYPITQLWNYKM